MLARQKRLPDPAELKIEPIGNDATYQAALAELQALEKGLAQSEKRRQGGLARLRGTKSPRSAVELARDLLRGGEVGANDPADDVRAADEERQILIHAIISATQQLDEIHAELSYRTCLKLRSEYAATLAAALDAMTNLANALDAAVGIRARLRDAGYAPLSTVLPDIVPQAARHLGSPENVGASQSWFFKKALQEAGLL
jgi:hypothetical protein